MTMTDKETIINLSNEGLDWIKLTMTGTKLPVNPETGKQGTITAIVPLENASEFDETTLEWLLDDFRKAVFELLFGKKVKSHLEEKTVKEFEAQEGRG